MGVVFKFTGTIPFLYLKEEAGVQRWKNNNDDDQLLVVRVYEKPVAISEKIHRRDFYTKENPRRTIETNMLKDNRYKIEREINKNDAAKHIIEYLDDQFTLALNKALL